jgi:hypothetical protein
MLGVRRIAREIKRRGGLANLTCQAHGLASASNVEAIEFIQLKILPVDSYDARTTYIEYTQLTALQKIVRAQLRMRAELEWFRGWHRASNHRAVKIGSVSQYLHCGTASQEKGFSQFSGRHPWIPNCIFDLSGSSILMT